MVARLAESLDKYQRRNGASYAAFSLPVSEPLLHGKLPTKATETGTYRENSGYAVVRIPRDCQDGYDLVSLPPGLPEVAALLGGNQADASVSAPKRLRTYVVGAKSVDLITVPHAWEAGALPRFYPPAAEVTPFAVKGLVAQLQQLRITADKMREDDPGRWNSLADQQSAYYEAQTRQSAYPLPLRGAPVFENAQLANLHRLLDIVVDRAPELAKKIGLPTTHEELDAFLPQLTPSDPYGPDVVVQFGDPSRGNTIITHPRMVDAFGAIFDGSPMPVGLAEEVFGHMRGLQRRLPMADLSIDPASLGASVAELEATLRSSLAEWDAHLNPAGPPERFSALPDERTRDERTRLFNRNAVHVAKGDARPKPDPFAGRSRRDVAAALLSPMGVNQMAKTVAELWYQFIDADLMSIGNADHDLRRLLHQLPGHSAVILDTWTDMIGPVDTERLAAARRAQDFESGFIDFLRGLEDDGSGWVRVDSQITARAAQRVLSAMGKPVPPVHVLARLVDDHVDRHGLAAPVPPQDPAPERDSAHTAVETVAVTETDVEVARTLSGGWTPSAEFVAAAATISAAENRMRVNSPGIAREIVTLQSRVAATRKKWVESGRRLAAYEADRERTPEQTGTPAEALGRGADRKRGTLLQAYGTARDRYRKEGAFFTTVTTNVMSSAIGREAIAQQRFVQGRPAPDFDIPADLLAIRREILLEDEEGGASGAVPSPSGVDHSPPHAPGPPEPRPVRNTAASADPAHFAAVAAAQGIRAVSPTKPPLRRAQPEPWPSSAPGGSVNGSLRPDQDRGVGPYWERSK
ncbi:hypothetical protein GCM10023205_54870 [Yinghuangia aomiensis]|uniref:Uncharacterized protein n=1 Tax=Yinghuangia aomiensis TaxID=676205 RepID=A0ABP9HW37_9ACTN